MKLLLLIIPLCGAILLASCGDATSPVAADTTSAPPPAPPLAAAAAVPAATAAATGWPAPRRVIFMHRSVGGALLRNGIVDMFDVNADLNARHDTALELWHHFCGVGPYWNRYYDGTDTQVEPNFGPGLEVFPAATPEQWERVFCAPDALYVAARDSIDNFRVIIFKSGYDNTVPYAATRAGLWRDNYRAMRDSPLLADPGRRTIVLGFPPNREGLGGTTQLAADSSRAFNTWLVEEFVRGHANLYAFPLFDRLAGADNWLREEYEIVSNPNDAHPNAYGCEIVGGELMAFIHAVCASDQRPAKVTAERCFLPAE